MPPSLSIYQLLTACGVVTLGSMVQGSVGFGMALISAPILLLINPVLVPGPLIASSIYLNFILYIRERSPIRIQLLSWAFAGYVVGSISAGVVVRYVSERQFSILFAVMVLIAVLLSVCGLVVKLQRKTLAISGLMSGFMGTLSSIGGPPMALVLQKCSGPEIRSSLGLLFFFSAFIATFNLWYANRFGMHDVTISAIFFPVMMLGFYLSRFTRGFVDRRGAQPVILCLCVLSAILVLLKTF